ncbi:MAG: ABC transporter ATP-binding protein [Paracoccaceae bacterium]|jgi:iron complex transport system ATP-binding protein|uniref:ABC transporter ATP-binding protein n=1 Tax=unclassified Seohaeicola TaxID=2641111 RepID=UPI00237A211A|nr:MULTISPECIES: ABC transporter ATP-binding protein [unclassified Seohaeicola]MDD9706720.1 ABC transporter ATP-binding protein [Seohaeicola sp. 4SK31]MDD9734426.1 ABC transporter ATP-binding protein [Seohaeicola sp. SP36]MDF1706482.1 ABC transporter ATP-binding protein [Paracoccaceae bacterium]MDM7968226.1 ABC transporter ATP-binding protein [Paracoccaceae bacterium]
MTLLSLDNLTVRRGECPVVDHVSLSVHAGECVGLIGPNGAGKTTLLRAALGLEPFSGASSLASLSAAERARAAAFLPQARQIAWPMAVETLVALGRVPHLPRGSTPGAVDRAAIDDALHRLGLDGFRQRIATQLSGGEQGRVLIARALAQQTPLLLADEPIAGLDPAQQIATMQVFSGLAQEGRAVVVSLHDLGLAARHCTRLILMHQGRLVADGAPDDVLTADLMAQVFGISIWRQDSPLGPVLQPMGVL